MPASDSLFWCCQKTYLWFSVSIVPGSPQYLEFNPQNFLHLCVPWWLPYQSSQGLFSRLAHKICWELWYFPGPWAFATSCSPATAAVVQSLHQGALCLITVLCSLLEAFMYTFWGNTSLQGTFQREKRIPLALPFCSFLSTHPCCLGISYFLQELTRGCNYFWALLCWITWECPRLRCACEQKLHRITYELKTKFLCKHDDGQLLFCCTKVVATQVLSAAGGE